MADSELRQRKAKAEPEHTKPSSIHDDAHDDDKASFYLDILRVLSFIIVASCGLSYVVTGGSSWTWGGVQLPEYARTVYWKERLSGPMYMTPEELAQHNGADPEKPLYLAINGTIYDVSVSRHIYGPGGSYQYFGGRDAARAYVTGCFAEDAVPDMRGVEEMYLPIDDPEVDAYWTTAQMEEMKKQERAAAEEKTFNALKHWVDFFAKSKKYHRVGYLKREEGWLDKMPRRQLCAPAQRGRAKRKIPKV
ncbi:Membrane steroid-binding protein-like protein [Emericellopsis cladophorae]|uniref:Membrane steroid-binding protein-like protein n=1 Tax=Emericellopsis cladophorae TaxID=2686198 RepID=A0A9P9Y6L2_9HYPO|nr:Membrane steroid-binding protein-like protein [Emericellopsis cladophorae]KAI6784285.1 Membrane steroid-binding protein-like protein [Emericellopsis cladophorae]